MNAKQLQELNELSATVKEWADLNFSVWRPKFGIVEEVGELAKCFLKRAQGIRGFDDFEFFVNETKDALGDVAIYTMHSLQIENFVLTGISEPKYELVIPNTEDEYDLLESCLGELTEAAGLTMQGIEHYLNDPIHESIFSYLDGFARIFNSDIHAVTFDVWNKVVSKRNWITNKETGV